jgi:hypothetical protein
VDTLREKARFFIRHWFLSLCVSAISATFVPFAGPHLFSSAGTPVRSSVAADAPSSVRSEYPAGPAETHHRRTSGGHASPTPVAVASAPLPDAAGVNLAEAKQTARHAGFHRLTSHDLGGRDRAQIVDRHWKVCDQSPVPGRLRVDTRVDYGVVKLAETCPSGVTAPATTGPRATTPPPATPEPTGTTMMPALAGRSLDAADRALDGTDVRFRDASGRGRFIIVLAHWQVCSTSPAAGEPYSAHDQVTIEAVKTSETCP